MKENTEFETLDEFKERLSNIITQFKKIQKEIQAHKKPNKGVVDEFDVSDTFLIKSKKH